MLSSLGVIVNPGDLFMGTINGTYALREYGPLFWFLIATLVFYGIVSFNHLIKTYISDITSRHKAQIRVAAIGMLILAGFASADVIVNVVFGSRFSLIAGLTSLGILLSGFCFLMAIQRYKMFNIVEVAQQGILDSINTGIIVLNQYDVVLEVNKVIRPYVDIRIGDRLDMEQFLAPLQIEGDLQAFMEAYYSQPPQRALIEVTMKRGSYQHASIYAAPIFDQYLSMIGRVITFQDVSQLRRLVDASHRHNEMLQERNRTLIIMQDDLYKANQKLEHMAITDSLTGCYNRRYLMQQLEHEVTTNIRYQIPFAIFLFDIDYFKGINDTYGHVAGDEVIRSTAEIVQSALRRTDILARYGGEEFTVYLPHTNSEQAEILADRIKKSIERNVISIGGGQKKVSVTISMGVLAIEAYEKTGIEDPKAYLRELFAQVDSALYEAKNGGRNQIVNASMVHN
ncbi:hypothetical protein GCM10010916_11310 [Paenibacillus abyssi]|uniref:GGDEF domain-containing protein n=1 Tax=Paenibacillus abyssi TaxID=1340531 RepID=A0A917CRC0_9BACL|nr:hypothetical protein GCM10010916_11310 [Paenibacillus abyssi]